MESGKLSLSSVKYFILDEADRLLDTGNQDLILNLFSRFPKAGTGTARLQVASGDENTLLVNVRSETVFAGLRSVKHPSSLKCTPAATDVQQLAQAMLCWETCQIPCSPQMNS